jgi:hypothetical protein
MLVRDSFELKCNDFQGVEHLAKALESNSTLSSLRLANADVGDDGAESLATALHNNSTVTFLDLTGEHTSMKLLTLCREQYR